MHIFDCSEMTTFSSSFVRTPKLDSVRFPLRGKDEDIWMGDLNKTIEHHFKEKENTGSGNSIPLEFDQMTGDLREDDEYVECTNEVSFNLALGRSDNVNMSSSSSSLSSIVFRPFSLNEIKNATNNFHKSNFLGKGGEGRVYLGHVATGQDKKFVVAVKQLKPDSIWFENEIKMVSKIQHPNLVSLLGYCNEFDHKILIYEYMQRGSLSDYVNKKSSICLSWKQRLKICLGAARGLQYLHTATNESPKGIIHRDMKPANILLDNNWVAKVSDFGMFRLSHAGQTKSTMLTDLKGTCGYFAPEYFRHFQITRKIDVYAFGVVLFEVLCRKSPWVRGDEGDESYYFVDDEDLGLWAHENVDSEINEEISCNSLKIFADIIGRSLRPIPGDRPTMDEVVRDLVRCQELEDHQGKHKIKRLNRPETQEQESEKETQEQESEQETQEQESEDGSDEHSDD